MPEPSKKLSRFQLAQRRRRVVELYLKGFEQAAIARELHISQASVCRDLEAIDRDWRESTIRDFELVRNREVEKLDLVEREAWAAWQRSQSPRGDAVVTENQKGQSTRKSLRHQHGYARFLDIVSKCISQRCVLLGLQPASPAPEGLTNDNVSLEFRRERIFESFAALSRRPAADPGRAGAGTPRAGAGQSQPGGPGPLDGSGEVADGQAPGLPGPAAPLGD
jgi:hypothetical protein